MVITVKGGALPLASAHNESFGLKIRPVLPIWYRMVF